MADNTYSLKMVGDMRALAAEIAKIPGMTQRAAASAALRQIEANRKAAEQLIRDQRAAAEKAGKAWSDFTGGINFAVTAGDLVNFGRAAFDMATALADAQNQIADIGASSGLAASTIKGLQLAMEGSGDSLDDIAPALDGFPKRLNDAARGAGKAVPAFKALGMSQAEIAEMAQDSDAAFRELLERVAAIENPTQKAAAATMIFGDAATKLLQGGLGNQGALDTFIAHADQFGLETGPRATQAADRWQRSIAELKLVLVGVASSMAESFGPGTAALLEDFTVGLVAGLEFVSFSAKSALQDLNFLQSALLALATGKASFQDVAREARELGERQAEAGKAALDTVQAYIEQRREILKVTGAIEGAGEATDEYSDKTEWATKAGKEAAAQEKERAKALADVEREIQRIADANALHFEGDAARRDQALRDLEAQAAKAREMGAYTAEADQTFAAARLRIWEDFWAKETAAEQKAAEESAKIAEKRAKEDEARLQAMAEAEAARRDAGLQAAQQLTDGMIAMASTLADRELSRRTSTAEDIREQLADEDAELTASQRRELEERLAAEEKAALRAFEIQKKTAQTQAVISGILSVQRAFELGPIAGALAAAGVGVLTAANVAAIAGQEPPQFHRGTDEVRATLRRDEAVLTPAAVDRMGGRERVRAANRGESVGNSSTEIKLQLNGQTLQTLTAYATGRPGRARRQTGGRVGHRGGR